MNAKDIIDNARRLSIELYVDNDRLKSKAKKGAMSPELREQIKHNKQAIIDYLKTVEATPAAGAKAAARWYKPSFAQQRLWFIDQLEGASAKYNIPIQWRLQGELDHAACERAIATIIQRHEVLRTRFMQRREQVYQRVDEQIDFSLPLTDLSDLPADEREQRLRQLAQQEAQQAFDLQSGPLLRGQVLKLAAQQWVLLITVHHIAFDGWSTSIFFSELNALYRHYVEGKDNPLSALSYQYADYAQWQRGWLQGETLQQQLDYWRRQLADSPQVHGLPLDRPRPELQTFNGQLHRQRLDNELAAALHSLCRQYDVTLFMLLQTAFAVLVSRYSNDNDVLMGTPVAGRSHAETEPLIGFFVNTLPLRSRFDGTQSFAAALAANKAMVVDAFSHQHVPFEMLVEQLQPERSMQHSPFFQLTFSLKKIADGLPPLGELTVAALNGEHPIVKYDLELTAEEGSDQLLLSWNYNRDLFTADTISGLAESLAVLLQGICDQPQQAVARLPLLSQQQQQRLLRDWPCRDAWTPPAERTAPLRLQSHLAEAALTHDERTAVTVDGQPIGYRGLQQRAAQLAQRLIAQGIGDDSLVGVCMDSAAGQLLCQWAVLQTGAAYVPFDPLQLPPTAFWPAVDLLISDANADLAIDGYAGEQLSLSSAALWQPADITAPAAVTGGHLACVLPLPAEQGGWQWLWIEHGELLALLQAEDYPALQANTTLLSLDAASLHHSFLSWAALLAGAQITEQADGRPTIPASVDLVLITGAELARMADDDAVPAAAQWVIASERLDAGSLERLLTNEPAPLLWQLSGPVAANPRSRWHRISRLNPRGLYPITLNHALERSDWHSRAYVLDQQLQPQPVGVAGTLYHGGRWLPASLGDEAVTSPFRPGEWLVSQQQLARWVKNDQGAMLQSVQNTDGWLRWRGRWLDPQPLIAAFEGLPQVTAAWLRVAAVDGDTSQLVAYLQPSEAVSDISDWLQSLLPQLKRRVALSSLPAYVVLVDKLPRDAAGIVQSERMPPLSEAHALETYVAPANELEQQLCAIWQQLLELERVGAEDDFFLLGGHSLLATQLVSRIRQQMQLELPLRLLFEHSTVRELAAVLDEQAQSAALPPIQPLAQRQRAPLSFAQQRLWFIDQLEGGSSQYNMPMAYRLHGQLDRAAFERALSTIMQRHEVLRSVIVDADEQPCQQLRDPQPLLIRYIDFSGLEENQREQQVRELALADARAPFDLSADPMLRAQLIRLDEHTHVVLTCLHHIAADGWSIGLLFSELSALYNAYRQGRDNPLPPLTVQYADYAQWQRDWLQGEVLQQQLDYWRQQLDGIPPAHSLPLDHARPARQTFNGSAHSQLLDAPLASALQGLCQQQDVTLFMLLQTAFAVLLSRFSNEDDIVMGTPIAGRTHSDTEALIGLFVNTLALRSRIDRQQRFDQLLKANRQVILDAYTHQHIPFEMLVEQVQPERSMQHSPLFQILFAVQNNQSGRPQLDGLELSGTGAGHGIVKFDLELYVTEVAASDQDARLLLNWNYNQDLFTLATMERLAASFETLLQGVVGDPRQSIGLLPLLPASDKARLEQWNLTAAEPPPLSLIHQWVTAQAQRTPTAVAVMAGEVTLTYAELETASNQLAHYLRARGVIAEQRVGVCLRREPLLLIALLGILKAGAAYVPLDPEYPQERLAFMVADADIRLLLSSSDLPTAAQLASDRTTVLDLPAVDTSAYSTQPPAVPVHADNLAYLIYTSGSTGRPKGVAIRHGSASVMLNWAVKEFGSEALSGMLASTSVCFDLSIYELFAPLCTGGRVILARDALSLLDFNHWDQVTLVNTVPSAIEALVSQQPLPDHVRVVNLAGEALSRQTVDKVYANSAIEHLYNLYGPSEDTTYSTGCVIPREESTPPAIGQPLPNTRAYVLDAGLQPTPPGVVGELYLAGAGLARGYWDRPTLTAECFVPAIGGDGERMYRTGDLCRWRADGQLEYCGRIDHQVKVRGFRIELGEIESLLRQQAGVDAALVRVLDGDLGQQLVAYLAGTGIAADEALKQTLQARLPAYMVPLAFVRMEHFPLTANGKVDRARLPQPDWSRYRRQYVAPRDERETRLVAIFENLLPVSPIGIDDHFFELGGHSLLATRLTSLLRREFELELPLRTVFEQPTVRALAAAMDRHQDTAVLPPIEPADRSRPLALSHAQQRLWFIDRLQGGSAQYNMPMAMRLEGELDAGALAAALGDIIQRHEVLRSQFIDEAGEAQLRLREDGDWSLVQHDLSDLDSSAAEAEVLRLAGVDAMAPFDLSADWLLRATLIKRAADDHVLLLNMHHIISDGWSIGLLLRELEVLYNARCNGDFAPLPALPVQYPDYAQWQRDWLQGEVLQQQRDYWRKQLADLPPVHQVPLDYPRPPRQSYRGATHRQALDDDLNQAVARCCREHDVTLFMLLETVFALLLSRYSQSDDIVIGTPVAGRAHNDTEALIGFFVNYLVLRTRVNEDHNFAALLAQNKRMVLDAYSHQQLPFEMLVEMLQPERSLQYGALYQISFNLSNSSNQQQQLGAAHMQPLRQEQGQNKYDLQLLADQADERLVLGFNYNTDLFAAATIEQLAADFVHTLTSVITTPNTPLRQLPLIAREHQQRLLELARGERDEADRDQRLSQLFVHQARQTPQRPAVRAGGVELSYARLELCSERLARMLAQRGIGPGRRVGLYLPRCAELMIALLGVLRSGAAYVPLDLGNTPQRLQYIVSNAELSLVLTLRELRQTLALDETLLFDMDGAVTDTGWLADDGAQTAAIDGSDERDLAYIIYTSGSTGEPKGVRISHRAVTDYCAYALKHYYDEVLTGSLVVTSPCFDITLPSLYLPLLRGGCVELAPPERELETLAALVDQSAAAYLLRMTPEHVRGFLPLLADGQQSPAAHVFVLGGSALTWEVAQALAQRFPQARIYNHFGPTETTVGCAIYPLPQPLDNAQQGAVPIGRPMANTSLYVLDADQRLLPRGAPGELYIASAGISDGYVSDKAKTAASFIASPVPGDQGETLYRSGDRVRWTIDDQLVFIGRIDDQIKLRGQRIELGEISAQLNRLDAVAMATVSLIESDGGEAQLAAYVVPAGLTRTVGALDQAQRQAIREACHSHLQAVLPEAMVPALFVLLDSMPFTASGKINRRALPSPTEQDWVGTVYSAPENATQQTLCGIWQELLQRERIGIDDNFFRVGGHSLLATRLISRIRQEFEVELPLRTLFEQSTVRELAALLSSGDAGMMMPPIKRHQRGRDLPLSFAQQRLWFLDQLDGGSSQYNMPLTYLLNGPLDRQAFADALTTILDRHQVLRTNFVQRDGEDYQLIREQYKLPLSYTDFSEYPQDEAEQRARAIAVEDARAPFDLTADVLLRMQLIKVADDAHVLLSNMHHIASDGWSMGLLFKELSQLYRAYRRGLDNPLPELPVQYADYACWQRDWLRGPVLEQQLAYWREQLAACPPVHSLPLDHPRPARQQFIGGTHFQPLDTELVSGLHAVCQQHDVTLFMLLHTAFAVLVGRYANDQANGHANDSDVVMGTPIAGRAHADLEPLIGFFINTLPLRTRFQLGDRFIDLLQANRQTLLDAYTHQHIPFEMLVEELQPERNPQHSPLFQMLFALQNHESTPLEMDGLQPQRFNSENRIIKFDLELFARENGDNLLMAWRYDSALFEPATIERLAASYAELLHSIVNDIQQRIGELKLLGEAECRLLAEWNDTRAAIPGANLAALFAEQAVIQPQVIAVSDAQGEIRYGELEQRANQLAHYLRRLGIGMDQRVAIALPRGIDFVIAVLGIIKAGAAYVPLDRDYPPERLRFMLADSQAALLLTEGAAPLTVLDDDPLPPCETLDLSDWEQSVGCCPATPLPVAATGDSLAYLIYTSGSTGQPKGVAATHQAVIRLVREARYIDIQSSDRIAQASTVSFDAATFEIWGALLNGAQLVTLAKEELLDAALLRQVLRERDITTMFMTTALFNQVAQYEADAFNGMRHVLYGGERCDAQWVRQVLMAGGPRHLLHVYGPTEATTFATWQQVTTVDDDAVTLPIGYPTGNTQAYILDASLQRAPLGAMGELYLGGPGLARGYWRRPGLSAERFIPDPYSGEAGARLYRTGDLVRYGDQGQIEYLGRIDQQIKLRGFRIELGEVESRLQEQCGVQAAVAQVVDGELGQQLVAYVVVENDFDEAVLKAALQSSLPGYMVPLAIIELSHLPLTANGKLDRSRLPAPDWSAYHREYVAPRDATEEQLAAMFTALLPVEQVGIDDNFFELGGHSLLATRLISRVRQELALELPLRLLFERPTVRGLAAALSHHADSLVLPPITPADRTQPLALSYAQQRLWFIDQLEGGSAQYNMPMAVRLRGELNHKALQQTLSRIVQRHEVLRTHFIDSDGDACQVIRAAQPFELKLIDLSAESIDQREAHVRTLAAQDAATPFDLSGDDLLRGQLLRLSDNEHVLLLNMHHIASDGWSMGLLFNELSQLYQAYSQGGDDPFPSLPVQYADYAQWQRQWLQGEVLEQQLGYWREQLAELPAVHSVPLDHPRPARQRFSGARHGQRLDAELTRQLQALCQDQDVTLFMLLQTAFAVLLSRYSNSDDIVIGTPIAGRTHSDTERLIGFFVNTLVLRSSINLELSFSELLQTNRQMVLDAFSHQHVPFEMLVEELSPQRSLQYSPIFQIMFSLNNQSESTPAIGDLHVSSVTSEAERSSIKFDLQLNVTEQGEYLVLVWNFNTDLFTAASIENMAANFVGMLRPIAAAPHTPLAQLPLSSESERQRLLAWNQTDVDVDGPPCLHMAFEQQARLTPDAIAAVADAEEVHFAGLNERANRLAHYLLDNGVEPGSLVAICMPPSLDLVTAILAILKAGCAYVPIDPEYPAQRVRFLLQDSEAALLLTHQYVLDGLIDSANDAIDLNKTLCLDQDQEWRQGAAENPGHITVGPEDLAYVIYTSGSSGQPKGVMIEHAGVMAMQTVMQRQLEQLGIDLPCSWGALSSFSFDASVKGLLLMAGGCTLHLINSGLRQDASRLIDYYRQQAIPVLNAVPALINSLLPELNASSDYHPHLIVSGDAVNQGLAQRLADYGQRFQRRIINAYGPTETTINSAYGLLSDEVVHIGAAVENQRCYVLDRWQQPAPIGAVGELYIGGCGLARGYLKQPQLTAERFVRLSIAGEPEQRLYRTGDLVRWLADGRLQFIGRNDQQVQVNGNRVELAEIEYHLLQQPAIDEALVQIASRHDGQYLVAYLISAEKLDEAAIKQALQQLLPAFMVPLAYIRLPQWPLNDHGKIDLRALPAPDWAANQQQYVAPRTHEEQVLVELYAELLNVEQVGIDDDFFALGGHSLLATRLTSRIRKLLQVELPLRVLFEQPTVRGLAAILPVHRDGLLMPPIEVADRDQPLALSFAQQRLWFIDQLEGGSVQYNMPMAYRLLGDLDVEAFSAAVTTIVQRHEVLRTVYAQHDQQVTQVVHTATASLLQYHDLSEQPASERESTLSEWVAREALAPFDLTADYPIRIQLIRLDDSQHAVLCTLHHIAADGWSMGLFFSELNRLYRAYRQGLDNPLPPLPLQYADYAQWQRQWLSGSVLEQQLDYWRQQLADSPPVHNLPLDFARPRLQQFSGNGYRHLLGSEIVSGLRRLCQQHNVTLFMLLQTAFAVLISRYSNERDVVMGTPIAGRTHSDTEKLIGFFVNTLALRSCIPRYGRFDQLLADNKQMVLDAYTHQHLPLEMLVEQLQPERSLQHSPLFQILFALQNNESGSQQLADLELGPLQREQQICRFDLELSIREGGDQLLLSWNYSTALFKATTIERLAASYQQLLQGIIDDITQPVAALPMLSSTDRTALAAWNQTATEPLNVAQAHCLFEQQVVANPAAIAVVDGGRRLNYAELNEQANRLAHYLRAQGVGAESRVGVCLPRSAELLIAVLAVHKAGAAYVPMDTANPPERLRTMVADAGVRMILTLAAVDQAQSLAAQAVAIDTLDLAAYPSTNPVCLNSSDHLAYVIYTSGSTGQPKGVAITHAGLLNLINWHRTAHQITASSRGTLLASIGFDASVWELWPYLAVGGSLLIISDELRLQPQALIDELAARAVTHCFMPTPLAEQLSTVQWPEQCSLQTLLVGGDQLNYYCLPQTATTRLINHYGPSESTVVVTWFSVTPDHQGAPPIGRPIANTRAYVLDSQLHALPIGVVGELYLGGAGLARGYLDRPSLTAERFVPNPYAAGERLYRTGDLCRYRADGEVDYVGRIDDQIKLRGFRIELGEVESQLQDQSGVKAAVAQVVDGELGQQLVAYVVVENDFDEAALKAALQSSLPGYMVPLAIMEIGQLPLTTNGKLDRSRLPVPDWSAYRREYVAPRDATEEQLAAMFTALLPVEQVGIDDNFFELGGHSLLATRLISQVRQDLELELPLRLLFERPTVRGLAAALSSHADRLVLPPVTIADRGQPLALSYAQQRLWFIDHLESGSAQYNLPLAVRLRGALDQSALQQTLSRIVQRHEVLRTHFIDNDGEACQLIRAAQTFDLPLIDLSAHNPEQREAQVRRLAADDAARPFDLGRDIPIRGQLLRLGDEEHVLLLNMHHIASDGWSMGLLFNELNQLYQACSQGEDDPLPPLPVQYADYAQWQRQWLQGEVLEQQLGYWRAQLNGLPPVHSLPLDHPRPARQRFSGARHGQRLDAELTQQLQALCQAEDVTLFMLLQTAFAVLLSRYSNSDDIVMGTPIAGRTHSDTERLIGFFVNTLVLRSHIGPEHSFSEMLQANRQMVLDAFSFQHVPFEMLVEELSPQRSLQYSPIFQIMFSLNHQSESMPVIGDLQVSPVISEAGQSSIKFDLQLSVTEQDEHLVLVWNYNTDLFKSSTIERLATSYLQLLQGIIGDISQPVAALPLLSLADQNALVAWNQTATESLGVTQAHCLFEQQAAANPDAIAVVDSGRRLNYAELNERANRLAHYLQAQGVGAESRVGVCLPRSAELLIAVLAVHKAGGAYVPMDPTYPQERLRAMTAGAGVRMILTLADMDQAQSLAAQAVAIDALALEAYPSTNLACLNNPGHLAYVIYTSGSTGQPKGVAITHAGLLNLINWHRGAHQISSDSRGTLLANIGFDASVWELWPYLAVGGSLLIISDELRLQPQALIDELAAQAVTHCFMPTPLAEQLSAVHWPEACGLQTLLVGGDLLNHYCLPQSTTTRLINHYGPSESTVVATWFSVPPDQQGLPPIGRPIANTQAYVLDSQGYQTPPGVVGELYLSGDSLARAYLGEPALTAASFIPNPYSARPGERMYRTGDLCRYRDDGELMFIGRADHQVKLRGYRIELGEIENQLLQQPGVRECIVRVLDGDIGRQLVAYIVGDTTLAEAELKTELRRRLPAFMVPLAIIQLDHLPLTTNGKIDRQSLPVPQWDAYRQHHIAPRDADETAICDALQSLLPVDRVGIDDHFFELGGHSLLAVRLLALLREQGIELSIRDVFEQPTARGLAELYKSRTGPRQYQPLHWLQSTDTGLPTLYCVPGIGGMSQSFNDLARAAQGSFNVAAFEHRGVDTSDLPHQNMDAIVACFHSALLAAQTSGPFYLTGHSFGGCVAYELARLLRAEGYQVRLILLDSLLMPQLLPRLREDHDHARDEAELSRAVAAACANDSIDTVESRLQRVYAVQRLLNDHYRPQPGPGIELMLLHASDTNATVKSQEYWQALEALTGSTVPCQQVAGGHLSMLTGESAAALVRLIGQWINH